MFAGDFFAFFGEALGFFYPVGFLPQKRARRMRSIEKTARSGEKMAKGGRIGGETADGSAIFRSKRVQGAVRIHCG